VEKAKASVVEVLYVNRSICRHSKALSLELRNAPSSASSTCSWPALKANILQLLTMVVKEIWWDANDCLIAVCEWWNREVGWNTYPGSSSAASCSSTWHAIGKIERDELREERPDGVRPSMYKSRSSTKSYPALKFHRVFPDYVFLYRFRFCPLLHF
jgi:hypothetical protein